MRDGDDADGRQAHRGDDCTAAQPPQPAVSVVLPVHNGARFLDEAIASIRAQTFAAFELLIVDDGSTDGSAAVAARHFALDRRLVVLAQPQGGIAAALNRGLATAGAPLVARMDADDVALPHRLERQVAVMNARPELAVLGTAYDVIDANGGARRREQLPLGADEIAARLPERNCLAHPTVMMRREFVLAAGGYRTALEPCEDYDLWLRLAERHPLMNLPEPLLRYREHAGQATWQNLERRVLCEVAAQLAARRRGAGAPDPLDGATQVDRALLAGLGVDGGEIDQAVRRRAASGAIEAARAGNWRAMRHALGLARAHGAGGFGLGLRCLLIRARLAA